MRRCEMKMKLRFGVSHADRERCCTSDFKHALLATPMIYKDADAATFAAGCVVPMVSKGGY